MIHIYAFLYGPKTDTIHWIYGDSRRVAFARVKSAAKLKECDLIMFDGEIYRYDHGNGMFIKTAWDKLDWEEE